jgi:hypothetical protein
MEDSKRTLYLAQNKVQKIIDTWTNYLVSNPNKLFRLDSVFRTYSQCLKIINQTNGFLITAFAGKAQNKFTHPSRLPDLGEVNLLTRIRAIQILTKKPVKIVLDGLYYAPIFHEEMLYIANYNKKLKSIAKLVGLNKEFPDLKTFYIVPELLKYLNSPNDYFEKNISKLRKNPDSTYKQIELYPKEIYETVERILPEEYQKKLKKDHNALDKVHTICSDFIIFKAFLSQLIEQLNKMDSYKRVTILKYSHTVNPRLNLEMNIMPWNSTILFKRSYRNINTAINVSYEDTLKDTRNYIIVGDQNYFWGFTRNKDIFQNF